RRCEICQPTIDDGRGGARQTAGRGPLVHGAAADGRDLRLSGIARNDRGPLVAERQYVQGIACGRLLDPVVVIDGVVGERQRRPGEVGRRKVEAGRPGPGGLLLQPGVGSLLHENERAARRGLRIDQNGGCRGVLRRVVEVIERRGAERPAPTRPQLQRLQRYPTYVRHWVERIAEVAVVLESAREAQLQSRRVAAAPRGAGQRQHQL